VSAAKNFFLHYDFRAPTIGPPAADLYAAALEQCAWGEAVGFDEVVISSHHGCEDDYGPAPLVAATAIAARTHRLRIAPVVALPLYDPIHLAEEVAVLDLLALGRIELVVGAGYRPSEFAMFGRSMAERARRMEEGIPALRAAWSGESFEFRGRRVLVRPRPAQPGGPAICYAGYSAPAARRAARLADAFMPMPGSDAEAIYVGECRRLGSEPVFKRRIRWMFLFVTQDPDRAWARLAPHLLHVANSYARWMSEAGTTPVYTPVSDVASLRATGTFQIATPEECVKLVEGVDDVIVDPLFGGIPPELAEESLELIASRVIPAFTSPVPPASRAPSRA
jgi:alkanesulfonate monooxygenase SsuD/methylene tetrahydromethanopterin reductase-like flavin-dependent oxidoreductase (luciferase family)